MPSSGIEALQRPTDEKKQKLFMRGVDANERATVGPFPRVGKKRHEYLVSRVKADATAPGADTKAATGFYPVAHEVLDMYHGAKHGFSDAQKVLARSVVAFTSGNLTPEDNMIVAHRMISEGLKRDPKNPFLAIPHYNEGAFNRWVESIGPNPPPLTGHKAEKVGIDFFHKHLADRPDLHEAPGYLSIPGKMDRRTKRIVSYIQNGKTIIHGLPEKYYEQLLAHKGVLKNVFIPRILNGEVHAKNWSMRGNIIRPNLLKLQKLVRTLGESGAAKFLMSEHKRSDFPVSISSVSYAGKDHVPGSFIFGPKFGAYHRNISGDSKQLTMDLWFARTMGRYLGKGATSTAPKGDPQRREWYAVMKQAADELHMPIATLQSLLWHREQQLHIDAGIPIKTASYQHGIDRIEGGAFHLQREDDSDILDDVWSF